MTPESAKLEHPNMRFELINYLEGLSSIDYQNEAWVNKIFHPPVIYDDFDLTVHFLFDDTNLADDAETCIGVFLFDQEEAKQISVVCASIDSIFDKYGLNLTDKEYISLPEWHSVIEASQHALKTLTQNNKTFPSDIE